MILPRYVRLQLTSCLLSALLAGCVSIADNHSPKQLMTLYDTAIPPNGIAAPDEETLRDPKEPFPFLLNVSRPSLAIFLPVKPDSNQPAVIICPGGAYRGLSINKEGYDVARAFNKMGVAAIVLKYRVPSDRTMTDKKTGPLQDVQQAFRIVRNNALAWHINPDRIGIVGFSAGGHLAATASNQYPQPVLPDDSAPAVRPDFAVLVYPVISMRDDITHRPSRSNLLGPDPSAEQITRYSNELATTANTPPTFMVHAADDMTVPVANSFRYAESLTRHGVPVELLVFPHGGHGFGLHNSTTQDRWIDRCHDWLVSQGLLAK